MKTRSKALLLTLCAVVLVVATVFGTMAFLTDTEEVVNTFTVGHVYIDMDEAKVDEYGAAVEPAERVKANTYKLLPGHTYVKDPTVTVANGSEQAYVRMVVTVNNIAKLETAIPKDTNPDFYGDSDVFLLQNLVTGWDSSTWTFAGYTKNTNGSATYEFRYKDVVDARTEAKTLDALFDAVVVPGNLDNGQIAAMNDVVITVQANAIQADGFDNADAAWAAFDNQNP